MCTLGVGKRGVWRQHVKTKLLDALPDPFGRVCQMIRSNHEQFLKGILDDSCILTIQPAGVCEQRSYTYFAYANNFAVTPNGSQFSVIAQLESISMETEYPTLSQFQPNHPNPN